MVISTHKYLNYLTSTLSPTQRLVEFTTRRAYKIVNMKSVIILLVAVAVSCIANPMPQNGKFGAELSKNMGSKPNLNVFGSQQWSNDRGSLGVSGNHNRELGGLNRHQTNAAVQGKLDVFKSNDGKTVGSVFGSANHQWNSHAPNNKGYEYGGRIEHTWG